MKIAYISESLGSKKNGGSSLSGVEFLNFLRIKFNHVDVYTRDKFTLSNDQFYGNLLYDYKIFKTKYDSKIKIRSFVTFSKFLVFNFLNLFRKKHVIRHDILFVNSWSYTFSNEIIDNSKFKVCIVRGNPESFIHQSTDRDTNKSLRNASNYLYMFDCLIFVSSIGRDSWIKYDNRLASKINFYLPNSIDDSHSNYVLSQSLSSNKLDSDSFTICVVGSIQNRKAQDLLLPIAERLLPLIPSLKFKIIGNISSAWGGQEIYNKLTKSRYSSCFHFLGHRDDVFEQVSSSNLALFLSRAEAFPRTVAEYMSLELPIVASNVSGVPEMIVDNSVGLLFDNSDIDVAVKHIFWCYQNYDLALTMGKNARIYYLNNFSKDKHITNALKVFDKIESYVS